MIEMCVQRRTFWECGGLYKFETHFDSCEYYRINKRLWSNIRYKPVNCKEIHNNNAKCEELRTVVDKVKDGYDAYTDCALKAAMERARKTIRETRILKAEYLESRQLEQPTANLLQFLEYQKISDENAVRL